MNTLRRRAQGLPGTPPLGYASAPFGYAASPFQEFVPVDGALGYAKSPVVTKAPPAPVVATTVRPALWVRGFGEWERRDTTTTVATTSGPVGLDLGYRSSLLGVTFGGDLLISRLTSPSDGLIVGIMGGFVDTDIRMRTGGTHSIDGGHIGVYSTYFNGGFFADAMFKVDLLNFGTDILVLPSSADLTNYNVTANIGYKFDLPSRFYIEPTIGIEHVESDYSNQTITAATLAILEDSHFTRGRFGARFGTEWMSGNVRFEPSILFLGYYYFDATGATIQGGGAAGGTIALPTDDGKFRGEIQASLNVFDLSSGMSGFVRGDIRFQDDLFGGGGRVGLRYQW